MPRRKKLIKIRKPKLRVTPKGIKITRPSARVGGKAGLNLSSSGVSASYRTKHGTISTGRSKPGSCSCCGLTALSIMAMAAIPAMAIIKLTTKFLHRRA